MVASALTYHKLLIKLTLINIHSWLKFSVNIFVNVLMVAFFSCLLSNSCCLVQAALTHHELLIKLALIKFILGSSFQLIFLLMF